MKFEIEITEAEIRSVIEQKVRAAVVSQTNQYSADSYIKTQVSKHWTLAADKLIVETLNDSAKLRNKIAAELERKLRAQLAAVLKNATWRQGKRSAD